MSEFGLSDRQAAELKALLNAHLTAEFRGCVYIFGSRVRQDFRPLSDIDILIESRGEQARRFKHRLIEALENSTLPMKSDVVLADDLPESFVPRINREKRLLFCV